MWIIDDILDWFGEQKDRNKFIRDFNKAAKKSFNSGQAPTILEAEVSRGEKAYRHHFSHFIWSGFRIEKTLSENHISRSELIEIGKTIIDNQELVRKLISLGWDTLEVQDKQSAQGVKWALKEHAKIGGVLPKGQ